MELIFLTVDDVIFIQSEILSSAPITDIGKRSERYIDPERNSLGTSS
jgi:hypothetical protein